MDFDKLITKYLDENNCGFSLDEELNKYLGEWDFTAWASKKVGDRHRRKETQAAEAKAKEKPTFTQKGKELVATIQGRKDQLKAAMEGNEATLHQLRRAMLANKLGTSGDEKATPMAAPTSVAGPEKVSVSQWQKPVTAPRPPTEENYTLTDWIVESYLDILSNEALKIGFKEAMILSDEFANWIKEGGELTKEINNAKTYAIMRAEEVLMNAFALGEIQTIEESKYQEFFKGMLAKHGVKSPMELSPEDRKKFFEDVKKQWAANKKS